MRNVNYKYKYYVKECTFENNYDVRYNEPSIIGRNGYIPVVIATFGYKKHAVAFMKSLNKIRKEKGYA